MRKLKDIMLDECGASAIEYGLIASVIAVAAAGAMVSLGNSVGDKYDEVDSAVAEANSGN